MFKKLFIGLLILSALTSEGISNLPGAYYGLYTGSTSEASLLGDLNVAANLQKDNLNGSTLLRDTFSNDAFVLTYNSIQKLKLKNSNLYYSEAANQSYLPVSFIVSEPESSIRINKTTIFTKSGLSPPIENSNIIFS